MGLNLNDKLLWLQRDFGVYTVCLFDLKIVINLIKDIYLQI